MPWVYYVTDRKSCTTPLLENIQTAIECSMDFIQIREKDLPTRELFSLVTQTRKMALGHNTKVLVNDRLDIALAANLDGVHLGQNSISPIQVRRAVSDRPFIIGVSTHSLGEVEAAIQGGVDYVTFGPIFFTPSKAAYGKPVGLESLRRVSDFSQVPIFALGGVDRSNYEECLRAGAAGIAAIRLFQDPKIPLRETVEAVKQSCKHFLRSNPSLPRLFLNHK